MATEIPIEQPVTKADKEKAVKLMLNKVNKDYGAGSVIRLGGREPVPVKVIPTGFVHFDHETMQCGGIPRGRVIEIFGPESSGKTSIALQIIAEAQKLGGLAAYVDVEHALDLGWAKLLGVDTDNLLFSQPDSAEQALNIAHDLVTSGYVDIVVLDSVAALVPEAELKGDIGDSHVGIIARFMAQTLRKVTGTINKLPNQPTMIFLNQIREKIGVMYGNPETQPGGRALKFYASVRLDLRRKTYLAEGGKAYTHVEGGPNPVGARLKVKTVKNKVGSPMRESYIDLYFPDAVGGAGFDKKAQTLDLAFDRGVVAPEKEKSTKYFFKGQEVAVGKDASKAAVLEDPELYAAVEMAVIDLLKKGNQ